MLSSLLLSNPASKQLSCRSVLVLPERHPIGRIEEVFGPITEPLYALRYAAPAPMPESLKPGARVFSVPRLSSQINPEDVYGRSGPRAAGATAAGVSAAGGFDEHDLGSDEEPYFSDDEAEAAWRKQQVMFKRSTYISPNTYLRKVMLSPGCALIYCSRTAGNAAACACMYAGKQLAVAGSPLVADVTLLVNPLRCVPMPCLGKPQA